jgi:hypothetical protein
MLESRSAPIGFLCADLVPQNADHPHKLLSKVVFDVLRANRDQWIALPRLKSYFVVTFDVTPAEVATCDCLTDHFFL